MGESFVVQHHARRNFFGLDYRRVVKAQIEGVGLHVDVELYRLISLLEPRVKF